MIIELVWSIYLSACLFLLLCWQIYLYLCVGLLIRAWIDWNGRIWWSGRARPYSVIGAPTICACQTGLDPAVPWWKAVPLFYPSFTTPDYHPATASHPARPSIIRYPKTSPMWSHLIRCDLMWSNMIYSYWRNDYDWFVFEISDNDDWNIGIWNGDRRCGSVRRPAPKRSWTPWSHRRGAWISWAKSTVCLLTPSLVSRPSLGLSNK